MRTTLGASHRLRMKPAVGRIVIFAVAVFVEWPSFHRRIRTIVGQGENDGVARSAIGAVDVGILETASRRIPEFPQAVVAHGQVGRDTHGRTFVALACLDYEFLEPENIRCLNIDRRDARRGRGAGLQQALEFIQRRLSSLQVDLDSLFSIQDPSAQTEFARNPIDEGAKPHALHHSANLDSTGAWHSAKIWYPVSLPNPRT